MIAIPSQLSEPGIIEREPDALDNLTDREPESPMIASLGADDRELLRLSA
jgi:hypothetical protein